MQRSSSQVYKICDAIENSLSKSECLKRAGWRNSGWLNWGNNSALAKAYEVFSAENKRSFAPPSNGRRAAHSLFSLIFIRMERHKMQVATTYLDKSDRVLVDLSRQGDNDAFGELVRRHYRRCVDLANLIVRNYWDAEDQVQIACSKAHARLEQFHGDAEFATWLLRIVTNECRMFLREKRRARFVYVDDTERESDVLELPACGPDPEGESSLSELKQILRTEIRHVPPRLRGVMMLRDIQELPMTEVAEALQIKVPAAKSRLLRARAELGLRVRERCNNLGALSPLSRSAAPFNRVAYRRTMQPLYATVA
jgi:RNA polymerase sigma-70 factor (ECF subfamily)